MLPNLLGLATGLTVFACIWLGHVAVRKIEFLSPTIWLPAVVFTAAGIALGCVSLLAETRWISAVLGIAGITCLWDALELVRQQKRVRRGHAPANPNNPRHAALLAANDSATTLDLLKQEPLGCHR